MTIVRIPTTSSPIDVTNDAKPFTTPTILGSTDDDELKWSLSAISTHTALLRMLLPPPSSIPISSSTTIDTNPIDNDDDNDNDDDDDDDDDGDNDDGGDSDDDDDDDDTCDSYPFCC